MYPVLIGSRALQYWKPEFDASKSDWDVISYGDHEGCEVHDPDFLNNKDMTGYASYSNTVVLPDGTEARVMTMLGLAIIKRSHLWRSLHFDRHITMYHKFGLHTELVEKTTQKFEIVKRDLNNRTLLTKQAFPQGSPNLMQSVEDFFDDAVAKTYSHDLLHEMFAYEDKPLYTKMLRHEGLAWCEKKKWEEFTEEQKVKCIAEEVQVIAAERFLIPRDWEYNTKLAYMKSLNKVCTTLCSGWFRDYAIDNYPAIVNLYDKNRFSMVQSTIETFKGVSNES